MWQDDIDSKVDMERAIAVLPEREQEIIQLYAFGYTQKEIGYRIGYSERRIGQILAIFQKYPLKVHIE